MIHEINTQWTDGYIKTCLIVSVDSICSECDFIFQFILMRQKKIFHTDTDCVWLCVCDRVGHFGRASCTLFATVNSNFTKNRMNAAKKLCPAHILLKAFFFSQLFFWSECEFCNVVRWAANEHGFELLNKNSLKFSQSKNK